MTLKYFSITILHIRESHATLITSIRSRFYTNLSRSKTDAGLRILPITFSDDNTTDVDHLLQMRWSPAYKIWEACYKEHTFDPINILTNRVFPHWQRFVKYQYKLIAAYGV